MAPGRSKVFCLGNFPPVGDAPASATYTDCPWVLFGVASWLFHMTQAYTHVFRDQSTTSAIIPRTPSIFDRGSLPGLELTWDGVRDVAG